MILRGEIIVLIYYITLTLWLNPTIGLLLFGCVQDYLLQAEPSCDVVKLIKVGNFKRLADAMKPGTGCTLEDYERNMAFMNEYIFKVRAVDRVEGIRPQHMNCKQSDGSRHKDSLPVFEGTLANKRR